MKRLSLKNVEFSERLSEETNAFAADVYLDGQKFGYAANSGHGGCTDIHPYPEKKHIFEEAEAYAKSLPDITSEMFKDLVIEANLESVVDELFEKWLKEKDYKKGICFTDKNGRSMIAKFNKAIGTFMKTEQGRKVIQRECDKIKKVGGTVQNTNLQGINL